MGLRWPGPRSARCLPHARQCWPVAVWPCLAFSSAQIPFAVALPLLLSCVISVHQKNRAQTQGWWDVWEKVSRNVGFSPSAPAMQPWLTPVVKNSTFFTVHLGTPPGCLCVPCLAAGLQVLYQQQNRKNTWCDMSDNYDPEPALGIVLAS